MKGTLRHVGILVKSLEESEPVYRALGFLPISREKLEVLKMEDLQGNVIELVQGNWHPHIAVNWYADPDQNYVEVVKERQEIEVIDEYRVKRVEKTIIPHSRRHPQQ